MAVDWGIWVYNSSGVLVFSADGLGVNAIDTDMFDIEAVHFLQSSTRSTADATVMETGWKAAIIQTVTLTGRPLEVLGWFDWDPTITDSQLTRVYYKKSSDSTWINMGLTIIDPSIANAGLRNVTMMAQLSGYLPDDYDVSIAYESTKVGSITGCYIQTQESRDQVGIIVESTVTSNGTGNTLDDSGESWTVDEHHNRVCRLRPGDVDEEERRILSNTATQLTLFGAAWTANPATSDVYHINTGFQ